MKGDGQLCDGLTTPWQCQHCLLTSSSLFRLAESILPSPLQPVLWEGLSQTPILARLRGARGMALDMKDRKVKMRQALELPDVILSHSRYVQHMLAQAGLSQRIKHLPNGHEMSWAARYQGKSDSSILRFGYMGQIKKTKGVHLLIEAFQSLGLNGSARLDIWGDLAKHPSYTQRLKTLVGSTDRIALRGRFERNQLAQVLAEIDVLVVPSLWYENAPLVIQESFAAKTPVIATNLGGMAEAIKPDINGLLFERDDVADLARQLKRIVDEPELLRRLQAHVPPVKTIAEEVTELEEIYQGLICHKQHIWSTCDHPIER
jgi:glycosyltransferase involved in cell wall biosynthesis